MIGRVAGRSRGAPEASNPSRTCGDCSSGRMLADRLVELQLALLDELHGRGRGHGLGHRGDPEDRVERHGRALRRCCACRTRPRRGSLVGRRQRHDAGHLAGLGRVAEHLVDRGRAVSALLREDGSAREPRRGGGTAVVTMSWRLVMLIIDASSLPEATVRVVGRRYVPNIAQIASICRFRGCSSTGTYVNREARRRRGHAPRDHFPVRQLEL